MIAGRMKYKLRILKPVIEENGFGESKTEFAATVTVWAERVKLTGSRADEVGEHFPDYRCEFNIRANHAIRENWRVTDLSTGYDYTVTNIIPNIDRGFKTLVCDRINP